MIEWTGARYQNCLWPVADRICICHV